jgi:hypothetical protein
MGLRKRLDKLEADCGELCPECGIDYSLPPKKLVMGAPP